MIDNSMNSMEKQAAPVPVKGSWLTTALNYVLLPALYGSAATAKGYSDLHPDTTPTPVDFFTKAPWNSSNGKSWDTVDKYNAAFDFLTTGVTSAVAHKGIHYLSNRKAIAAGNPAKPLSAAVTGSLLPVELVSSQLEPSARKTVAQLPGAITAATKAALKFADGDTTTPVAPPSEGKAIAAALIDEMRRANKKKLLLGGIATAGALGLGGLALYKWLQSKDEDRASSTRMKMKISTPDGKDAVVDLPINNPSLSGKLEDEFNRGVTRTVRRTARYNSMKLDPMTNKFIPYPEWHKKYGQGTPVGTTGQEYTYKQARLVNMPKYNMVDCFPETAQDSGIVTTGSDKVKQFLQALDIPEQSMGKIAALQQFEADMKKQAAGIESQKASLSEIAGGITAPLLAGGAAGLIANKKFGLDTTNSVLVGGGTAMLAKLLGIAAAGMAPTRTVAEQATQDMESSALTNLLVPGIAQFNQVQRAKITSDKIPTLKQQDEQMVQQESKPVVQNTPLESDDLMDDEDI